MRKLLSLVLLVTFSIVGSAVAQTIGSAQTAASRTSLPFPAGFDYIGSQSAWVTIAGLFASGEATDFDPGPAVCPVSDSQLQGLYVKARQKVQTFEALVERGNDAFTNPAYKFRINIWDSLNAAGASPRFGNVLSHEMTGVSFGDTVTPWGLASFNVPVYRVGWDIPDTVLDIGKTYYFSVQLVIPDQAAPGYIFIAESWMSVSPSFYAYDYTCWGGSAGVTSNAGFGQYPNATMAYKANAVYCPAPRGSC